MQVRIERGCADVSEDVDFCEDARDNRQACGGDGGCGLATHAFVVVVLRMPGLLMVCSSFFSHPRLAGDSSVSGFFSVLHHSITPSRHNIKTQKKRQKKVLSATM